MELFEADELIAIARRPRALARRKAKLRSPVFPRLLRMTFIVAGRLDAIQVKSLIADTLFD
jgi:hypothetical protein